MIARIVSSRITSSVSTHAEIVPLATSAMSPEASLRAAPPADTTNKAYELMEIAIDSIVPFGIAEAGSFKSPQILAPA